MSHTTSIKGIIVTDILALRQAIEELKRSGVNCSLKENVAPRAYYENQEGMGVAPYVISLPDARYDIGLYHNAERGGYEARTDFFGGSVERVLGNTPVAGDDKEASKLGKFYQAYGIAAVTRAVTAKGGTVMRNVKPDGTIQLVARGI